MSRPDIPIKIKEVLPKAYSVLSKFYEFSDDYISYLAAVILDPRFKAQYLVSRDLNNLYDNIVYKIVEKLTQLVDAKHAVHNNENGSFQMPVSRF